MADQRHVDILLRDGVKIWNLWRKEEPEVTPDLTRADLSGANLGQADFSEANLAGARLRETNLSGANLSWASLNGVNLSGANLSGASLVSANVSEEDYSDTHAGIVSRREEDYSDTHAGIVSRRNEEIRLSWVRVIQANLRGADLSRADLSRANLRGADLSRADLTGARLREANLRGADLSRADLSRANLRGADLSRADLTGAILSGADLTGARLREANLSGADLTGAILSDCAIYGISAWDVKINTNTVQKNLRITPPSESAVTVDNLEVAQFLYLLLHNDRARAVLDTITSKVVLILGRFGEHKAYLDALREALRTHPSGYIPILFDFDPQADKPILETVKILANLARFVIADLTDPNMVRAELTAIIPSVPTVPVLPIVEGNTELPTEYASWALYRSFLPLYRYADLAELLANLTESVIEPAEGHVQARRLSDGGSS